MVKRDLIDLIDQAAVLLGKNRSDFMLEAACERAQAFTALLDAPASANPGLARLMAVQPPWDSKSAWACSYRPHSRWREPTSSASLPAARSHWTNGSSAAR